MNQVLALSIGSKIKETRKNKSINQEHLALLTTIDRSYLGRIERGKVSITVENSTKSRKHSMLTLKHYSLERYFLRRCGAKR